MNVYVCIKVNVTIDHFICLFIWSSIIDIQYFQTVIIWFDYFHDI